MIWQPPCNFRPSEDSVVSTGLIVLVTIVAILGTATAASAQTAITGGERPFRFQFEQSKSPRGLAVQGYVYNALPWRITNIRLQGDRIDANGTLVASASGWVPETSPPVAGAAISQTFDKVTLEVPAAQAP
jgi:hypothetical protein